MSLTVFATLRAMNEIPKTERTTLKRLPKRGSFDREVINAVLDEGFICHVGFIADDKPVVIPTGYARVGDNLIIHGSRASRMLCALGREIDLCVTVTLIDGLVLARSAFHHSMNYRSVVVFGRASAIETRAEKLAALRALSEHMIPGRWDYVRAPNERELQQTTVLTVALNEASAKIRTGQPVDDDDDYDLPIWAGILPLRICTDSPVADPLLRTEVEIPVHVHSYGKR